MIDIRVRMTSRGYLLGHEDVFNDRNYTTSVRCHSHEGTVLAMKADEFLEKMGLNQKTWNNLIEMANERDELTKKKIK